MRHIAERMVDTEAAVGVDATQLAHLVRVRVRVRGRVRGRGRVRVRVRIRARVRLRGWVRLRIELQVAGVAAKD